MDAPEIIHQEPIYKMTLNEQENVSRFIKEIKQILPPEKFQIIKEFIDHLCLIQNPYNKEYPFIDNIIHGIEVARICMLMDPNTSEALLLSALGHDWDRACGDLRKKPQDYPNTTEGNRKYKEEHAKNSADLFCKEMEGRFDSELIAQVHHNILNHEIGGEGDLATLDLADGMVFFSPDASNYYRNGRHYLGENKRELSPEELEAERKKGFRIKVKFMSETLGDEERAFLLRYINEVREKLNSVVREELDELLKL